MGFKPTVSVYGPKGHLVVNLDDVTQWTSNGYSTTPPAVTEAAPAVDPGASDKEATKSLRAKAAKLGVLNANKLKGDELQRIMQQMQPDLSPGQGV